MVDIQTTILRNNEIIHLCVERPRESFILLKVLSLTGCVALHYPCVFKNQPKTQLLQSKLVKDMGEHC